MVVPDSRSNSTELLDCWIAQWANESRALAGDPAREHVLSLLIQARLVTAQDAVVEISHEALARAWPRLRSWLEDDSAGQRILRHLAATADGWVRWPGWTCLPATTGPWPNT